LPVAFLLAQVGAQAAARFAERLVPLGLSPPQAGILRALGAQPGISQQALVDHLGIFPSRGVTMIDELERLELVERRDSLDDRRSYALHLTAKGNRALEAIGRVAQEHQDALLAALNKKERETLGQLLQRVADHEGLRPGVHPGFRRKG